MVAQTSTQTVGPITRTLTHLAKHHWITLRSLSHLTSTKNPTGIYARQRAKNPDKHISTILMGSTYRVYEDEVLRVLRDAPDQDQEASKHFIILYNRIKKEFPNE